jgi:hypothetical protein
MRRLTASAFFVAMMALSGTAAVACGDKLLAIGRGVLFQHLSAAHLAKLVIYSGGAQRGPLSSAKLQATLKGAVHNLQLVQDGSQLDDALKAGQVDVVLVELPTSLASRASCSWFPRSPLSSQSWSNPQLSSRPPEGIQIRAQILRR